MRQYEMFELSFSGKAPEGSQTLAAFEAEFTLNDKTTKAKGFYAGNETYKVRYYPTEAGSCLWKVSGIPGVEEELKGQETCAPAAEGHHGMVRVDGLHFRYEDGTAYLPFGTTVYAMIHQEREVLERTWASLGEAPFNKIRFCVFPKHYCFNINEPEYFAFEKTENGFDFDRPCYPFWDALDENLQKLEEMGIQADVIIFHPYDSWGFKKMTRKESMDYLDYMMRRLTAYPNVWWSLANEYDLMNDFEPERWAEFAAFLGKNDVYHHLLSNHNFSTPWDFANPDTTHCCLQASEAVKIPSLQKKFGKPVMFDEMGYEGNIPFNWGNLSSFEMVNRFWGAVCYGGYATHGETFMKEMNDEQELWWSKGGTLKGESPARIRFLKEILEAFPGTPSNYAPKTETSFESKEELRSLIEKKTPGIWDNDVMITLSKLDDSEFQRILGILAQPIIHYEDEMFLEYFGDMCTIYGEINLPEDKEYRLEVIDAWEMTRTVVNEHASGKAGVTLPGKPGMAILATRV